MNWNLASHITLVIFKLARQTVSMLYRVELWHYLFCAQENGGKSPIVQLDTTTTQFQGKTLMTSTWLLRPAVLVKTRVWVKGCSLSRAHKTWSRSFLFKDFQFQAPSENGLFLFCIFDLVQLIVPRI